MGFVNGEPAFSSRLIIPTDVRAGWVGLAVNSVARGQGAADLMALRAGFLRPRLAALAPTASTDETDQQLSALRGDMPYLTALCPAWFTIEPSGRWSGPATPDPSIYQVFARYHRVWLLPMVDCRTVASVLPSDIQARTTDLKLDGLTLVFQNWPGNEWITALADRLATSPLTVIVLGMESSGTSARIAVISGGTVDFGFETSDRVKVVRRAGLSAEDLSGLEGLLIGY